MKYISELILFRSKDKTPYQFKNDSIFAKVVPSTEEKQLIDELSLLNYDFRFTQCKNLGFSYETIFDQENKLPYNANSNGYNFTIEGIVGTGTNIFTSDDRLDFSDFNSNRYQAIIKTSEGSYFILYADLIPEDTEINNNDIIPLTLQAEGVKEDLYRINAFSLVPSAAQLINIDNNGNILLDSNNNLTINIDGNSL